MWLLIDNPDKVKLAVLRRLALLHLTNPVGFMFYWDAEELEKKMEQEAK